MRIRFIYCSRNSYLNYSKLCFSNSPNPDLIAQNNKVDPTTRFREKKVESVTISKQMKELMDQGKYKKALEIFNEFERYTPERFSDVVIRNQALKCCSHLGDYKLSKEIFHKMKRNFSHLGQPNLVTYNTLLTMYIKLERYEKVTELFNMMIDKKVFPDNRTFSSMFEMYGLTNNPERGDILLKMMNEFYIIPDLQLANQVLKMYSTCKKSDNVYSFFYSLKQKYNIDPDVVSYSIILDMHAYSREIEKAEILLAEMIENNIEPDIKTYTILIGMYGSCNGENSIKKMLMIYNIMIEKNIEFDLVVYSVLIENLTLKKQYEKANELYDKMIKKRIKPNIIIKTCLSEIKQNLLQESTMNLE